MLRNAFLIIILTHKKTLKRASKKKNKKKNKKEKKKIALLFILRN